ncbi:MAG: tRNA (adenosine(37)-N6)-dimethylallyltransferase MiaA [Eubacteriales bacterium]
MAPKIVVVAGPTASGKTRLAVALAKACNGEVVSADSMQIYQKMNIGTAKPTEDEMEGIPHHMIDFLDPAQDFSVQRYLDATLPIMEDILARGKLPIVAGGTGLYIDSLLVRRTFATVEHPELRAELTQRLHEIGGEAFLEELRTVDPDTATRLFPNDHKRMIRALEVYRSTGTPISVHNANSALLPPYFDPLRIGLQYQNRPDMWEVMARRVDTMLEMGLLEEVESLRYLPKQATSMQAIGYKELRATLEGEESLTDAVEKLKIRTRQYGKRQLTWFGQNPDMNWIYLEKNGNFNSVCQKATEFMVQAGLL